MHKKTMSYKDHPQLKISTIDWDIESEHDEELIEDQVIGAFQYADETIENTFLFRFKNKTDDKKELNWKIVESILKEPGVKEELIKHIIGYICTRNVDLNADTAIDWMHHKKDYIYFYISKKNVEVCIRRDELSDLASIEDKLLKAKRWVKHIKF